MREFTDYTTIEESEVEEYRNAGYRIHHEYEEEIYYYWDDESQCEEEDAVVVRDDWYAATPEFVERYRESGGTWGYCD